MKTTVFACVMATVCFLGHGETAPVESGKSGVEADRSQEELGNLVDGYYKSPNPAKAIALVKTAEKMLTPNTAHPTYGFYLGAVSKSLDRRDEWIAAQKSVTSACVRAAIDLGLKGTTLGEVLPDEPGKLTPSHLDLIWGWFMATGDSEAARRVIRRGGMKGDYVRKESDIDLTAMAARWSSVSLALSHPVVKRELEMFARTASEKEIVNFFSLAPLGENERKVLSEEAVKRIESILPATPE